VITQSENPIFRTANALGENHFPFARLAEFLDQARNIFRHVLTVGIHHQDRVTRPLPVDKTQANRDRTLVPEISTQSHTFDAEQIFQIVFHQIPGQRRAGTIVQENHLRSAVTVGQDGIQLPDEDGRALPVIVHRQKDYQVEQVLFSLHARPEFFSIRLFRDGQRVETNEPVASKTRK
jgi:hypothetical protein